MVVIHIYSTSQFGPAKFQVHNNYTCWWLIVLGSMAIEQPWHLAIAIKPCYFCIYYFSHTFQQQWQHQLASVCPSIHISSCLSSSSKHQTPPSSLPSPILLMVVTVASSIIWKQMLALECKMFIREKHLWKERSRKQDLTEEYVKLWWLLKALANVVGKFES